MDTIHFLRQNNIKVIILIILLGASFDIKLKAQIFFSPHITSTGTVTPLIQPKTASDIYHMPFFKYSDCIAIHCSDSILANSFFEGACLDDFDFTSSILNYRRFTKWANNPDPLSIEELDVSGIDDRWQQVNPTTWTYSSSTGISGEYTNRQTWKADEKKRLKKITRWYNETKGEIEIEYFYNLQGVLERITTTNYDINNQRPLQSHKVWFYDGKERTRMLLSYNGTYRKFTEQELEVYTKLIETAIRTGKHERISFKTIDIQSLLIYNNGANGPEQVNYYSKFASTEDVPVFVSDSVNYDSKGRISRYVSGKFGFEYRPYWVELVYEYEPGSSRLKQVVFHRYNERENESWVDNRTIQYFTYDSKGRINSVIEQQFHHERKYVDGKYTEPDEQLSGQNKYDFIYKR